MSRQRACSFSHRELRKNRGIHADCRDFDICGFADVPLLGSALNGSNNNNRKALSVKITYPKCVSARFDGRAWEMHEREPALIMDKVRGNCQRGPVYFGV